MRSTMHTSAMMRGAVFICTTALALGCFPESVLDYTDPDVLNTEAYDSPQGATPLRIGVYSDYQLALVGSIDGMFVTAGNMGDEIRSTDTFEDRLSVSSRTTIENNNAMDAQYRQMHRVHTGARAAIRVHQTHAPTPTFNIAQLYNIRGMTEIFFAEVFCSGVAFSEQDGATSNFGSPETTVQVLQRAVASFDTALTLADTSKLERYIAQVGKGRALLNLGQYASAAAAVTGVPTNFVNQTFHSTASGRQENAIWGALSVSVPRYTVIDREGTNGLPFLQTPADPRMPWATSTRVGFNSLHRNLPNQTKYGRTTAVTISDGVEARLIELEATLQGGTQADRDAVFAGLNALRATGRAGVVPPQMGGPAPTTQAEAVDLLFRERAYWFWLTGHRLGDLRRLVRQYSRPRESVFPTGALASPLVGDYGTDVNVIIPFSERNNPQFDGCINRDA